MADDICNDTRPCCLRGDFGKCKALRHTYERDGDCPFCKEHIHDTGSKRKELRPSWAIA